MIRTMRSPKKGLLIFGNSHIAYSPLVQHDWGGTATLGREGSSTHCWLAVQEHNLSYHDPETLLFTIYHHSDNLI